MTRASDYSKAHLQSLPTIRQGQADNLKIESATERVWISRLTKADGVSEDHAITVEHYVDGVWKQGGERADV